MRMDILLTIVMDDKESTKIMRRLISAREEIAHKHVSFQQWIRLEIHEKMLKKILLDALLNEIKSDE